MAVASASARAGAADSPASALSALALGDAAAAVVVTVVAAPRLFDVVLGVGELRELLAHLARRQVVAAQPAAAVAASAPSATAAANPAALCGLFHAGLAPPALHRILAYKACRGAVMFGTALSRRVCVEMVARLAACALPFQCAHGRPAAAPLVLLSGGGED